MGGGLAQVAAEESANVGQLRVVEGKGVAFPRLNQEFALDAGSTQALVQHFALLERYEPILVAVIEQERRRAAADVCHRARGARGGRAIANVASEELGEDTDLAVP